MNAFIELSSYAIIKISGDLAKDFLQGQITYDMNALLPDHFALAAYCNPQGRIWSIFRIWKSGDNYFLCLPAEVAEETANDFKKYAQFSKVGVELQENDAILSIVSSTIPHVFDHSIPTNPFELTHENALTVLCIDSERWLVISNEKNMTKIKQDLIKNEAEVLPSSTWDLLEVRAGIPTIWKKTINTLLPHDLNLPELNAVSFEKGCYKGQEIISRMQYRAQRKKHLYKAHYRGTTLPVSGTPVWDDVQKNVGEVVSAAEKLDGGYELLAVVSDAVIESNKRLTVDGAELSDIVLAI